MSDDQQNEPRTDELAGEHEFAVNLASQVSGVAAAMLLHQATRRTVYGPLTMELVLESANGLLALIREGKDENWRRLLSDRYHETVGYLAANRIGLAAEVGKRGAAFGTEEKLGPCPFNTPEWWETGRIPGPGTPADPPSAFAEFLKGTDQ